MAPITFPVMRLEDQWRRLVYMPPHQKRGIRMPHAFRQIITPATDVSHAFNR